MKRFRIKNSRGFGVLGFLIPKATLIIAIVSVISSYLSQSQWIQSLDRSYGPRATVHQIYSQIESNPGLFKNGIDRKGHPLTFVGCFNSTGSLVENQITHSAQFVAVLQRSEKQFQTLAQVEQKGITNNVCQKTIGSIEVHVKRQSVLPTSALTIHALAEGRGISTSEPQTIGSYIHFMAISTVLANTTSPPSLPIVPFSDDLIFTAPQAF